MSSENCRNSCNQLKTGGKVAREPNWEIDKELEGNRRIRRDGRGGDVAEMACASDCWSISSTDVAACTSVSQ